MPRPTSENNWNTFGENFAGGLQPHTSEYGQAFKASLPEMFDHGITLVDPHYFVVERGIVGIVITRAAQSQPLFAQTAQYGGDLPLSTQSTIAAPEPWIDPFITP